jgi:stage V sporulation protein G
MEHETDVKVVRVHRFEGDSKTKAFVDIALGDFIVKGLRVVGGKNGLFLSMPQEKAKDGKWYSLVFPATKEARQRLTDAVLTAYQS